ncbi:MAG: YigZ family protein [Bowdeniella nasicola]|nr:YigZ family protein [Bowdeniella nasicola]
MAPFLTLKAQTLATSELEIKRSRFLGYAQRCDSEEAAREFFADIRHTYPDARHHCTAMLIDNDGQELARSSDDGEPSGTAGMPMLTAIRGSGLMNLAVVVVRYFGGIKLGTGGLVRAYSETTSATLAEAELVQVSSQPVFYAQLDHSAAGKFHADAQAHGVQILHVDYGSCARFTLSYDDARAGEDLVAHLTGGQVEVTRGADRQVERPYR